MKDDCKIMFNTFTDIFSTNHAFKKCAGAAKSSLELILENLLTWVLN